MLFSSYKFLQEEYRKKLRAARLCRQETTIGFKRHSLDGHESGTNFENEAAQLS